MNLELATQKQFGSVVCDFWQNENNEVFMTALQLSESLGYANKSSFDSLISRNEYVKDDEFSATCKLQAPDGKSYETRIFNEDGIYEVSMLAKTQVAKEFRAFVRKTLKTLRKGEAILIQPKTKDAELEIKRMNAEARLLNAKTRQASLILKMQNDKTLSPVAVELLNINALEVITEKSIEHRPQIEKTYTATEIGEELNVTSNKIGRWATKYKLKTAEYGIEVLDKSPHSHKQVPSFRYNEKGRTRLKEIAAEELK